MNPAKLFLLGGNIPVLVVVIYVALSYRRLPKELQVFSAFIFLSACIQLVSFLFWYKQLNNLFLSHLYVGLGFLCLAWFYQSVLDGFLSPGIIRAVAILFFTYTVFSAFFVQKITVFNSHTLTVESILVVILSLSTYIMLLNQQVREARKSILQNLHWINSGLFIYFSSSLLLFYFGKLIMHRLPLAVSQYTWTLHAFFSNVMYVCFFIGLWKRPRN